MSVAIEQIIKSRTTVIKQFEEQGYNVSNYSYFSKNEVSVMYETDGLDMIFEHNVTKQKVYIKYCLVLRMNSIDDIVNNLFNTENETSALLTKNDTLYIITKNEVNAVLNEKVKDFWARDGYFIVIQPIKRLQFNILKLDKIVPYQRLITENEKEELINKIKDVACLPEISRFDPIAKILCLRPGMISVSERPSKTAIIEKYYRLCLNV